MSNILRRHEPILGHIPLLNVLISGGVDIYEDTAKTNSPGPYLSADIAFQVGPVAVPHTIITPLANGKTTSVTAVAVPVPILNKLDVDIEATIVDYSWHSADGGDHNGVVHFNLRVRVTASHLAGFQVALIPVVISLLPEHQQTKEHVSTALKALSGTPAPV